MLLVSRQGFVHDLEVNRLVLDNKVTDREREIILHLPNSLETIDQRRLEVIMTGAVRTLFRPDAGGIKKHEVKTSP